MFGFFSNLKIGAKISIILLLVVLVAVAAVSFFAYNQSKSAVEERYLESLNGVADLKVEKLQTFIGEINSAIQIGQELKPIKDFLKGKADANPQNKTDEIETIDFNEKQDADIPEDSLTAEQGNTVPTLDINPELDNAITAIQYAYKLNNVYILDREGKVKYIARETPLQVRGEPFSNPKIDPFVVVRGRDTTYFSKVTLQQLGKEKKVVFLVSAPVRDEAATDRVLLGQIIYEVDMARVEQLISDKLGLGKTGQIWLLQEQEGRYVYINAFQDKNQEIKALDKAGDKEDASTPRIVMRALKKEAKHKEAIDERDYLAVSRFIPGVEWGVVVKNDKDEIYAPAIALLQKFLLAGSIVILISLIIGILFSQLLTRPLAILQRTIDALGRGELPPILNTDTKDEIGEMTDRINSLVLNLSKTATFAQNIGNQNYSVPFTPLSEKDILGNALINAQKSLAASAEASKRSSWVVEREAEVGNIMRSTDKLSELADQVLAYIVKETGAVQGALYVMKKDETSGNDYLEMIASYAYNKKKYLNAKFKFHKNKYAEGLVGQAAIEKSIIRRTEIPDEYVTITSGLLGEQKPKFLHITPLITNDTQEVYGVIELASFEPFLENSQEDELMRRIGDIIARTIFNINVNEQTKILLEEQQKLTNDLQENQEILRRNAEELERTNAEMAKQNRELEESQIRIQNEQRKTQVLLENSSEIITIYKYSPEKGIYLIDYVSPSVKRILGYDEDFLRGKTDLDYIVQGRELFQKMFEELVQFPDERHAAIQFLYKKENGDDIWLEATGSNLLNDPAIEGIVINTRDITERRKAEREERMRGQMQALSENSTDLIVRMNRDGFVYYINPVIENLTGKPTNAFLQKTVTNELLPQEVLNTWFKLIETTFRRKVKKISDNVNFETIEGRKIMNVNVIPETNEDNETETFLIVSHDITQSELDKQKIVESEKKVKDSINYAKRIQSSILPDTTWLQSVFKDSFVLFKPKDIVSGDFPWMLKTETSVYIAVVDCTGHGVPGALISLIGYFLLNNIFSVEQDLSPGEVLDLLDESVVRTLRQTEEDSISKDGMDVSLCKIIFESKTMQYAGAHRPLYYVDTHKSEIEEPLEEIKGDKMPVGGGQYKNRGAFVTHTRQYQEGDMIVLFSDGLPDQFGGPDNRKFSPKRLRDLIRANLTVPMMQINDAIEEELKIWMRMNLPGVEPVKQTDDILIIGVRF
ncbi:MAG: hypothetical protein OHK0045_15090 [Raineya sp.]